jgi:hypothetical protein
MAAGETLKMGSQGVNQDYHSLDFDADEAMKFSGL